MGLTRTRVLTHLPHGSLRCIVSILTGETPRVDDGIVVLPGLHPRPGLRRRGLSLVVGVLVPPPVAPPGAKSPRPVVVTEKRHGGQAHVREHACRTSSGNVRRARGAEGNPEGNAFRESLGSPIVKRREFMRWNMAQKMKATGRVASRNIQKPIVRSRVKPVTCTIQ